MDGCRILHLSDTHFGAHDQKKCDAVLRFAQTWRPDITVITGDLMDFPVSGGGALDRAAVFLQQLRAICANLYCVPGNHDAMLGGWFRDKMWRKLHPWTSFVENITVRGTDVVLIGVDTTRSKLRHLNSSGTFDAAQERRLEQRIAQLRADSTINIDRAICIVLAHHHPVPTVTSLSESMLYMRNAGQLLRFANRHRVRLILHGHQHDPHFTKIAFGSDQDDDVIGVLSAGSCSKADAEDTETSGCGHFYAITIEQARADAQSYWYHRSIGRYVWLNQFGTARASSPEPQLVSVDQNFEVTAPGDMRAFEIREYKRTHNRPTSLAFNIGVDDDDAGCPTDALGLNVSVNGTDVPFTVVRDEPTLKYFRVDLPAGTEGARLVIRISYAWPKGFSKFLLSDTDSGEFTIRSKGIAWCRLRITTEEPRLYLDPIAVFYHERDSIEDCKDRGRGCGFTIYNPKANSRISWTASIRTAPPS